MKTKRAQASCAHRNGGSSVKTAIVYYSRHHGNTKKLVEAIAAAYSVTLIDVTEDPKAEVFGFDRIGLASGIYYSSFAKPLLAWAEARLPEGTDVFFLSTQGNPAGRYFRAIRKIARQKNCRELGCYGCLGFDTFGPFKLIGGISKGHPTEQELAAAVRFYGDL